MSFFSLILKNLLRQKVRASLTLLGISLGITTVVALGVITEGFKASAGGILTARGGDFIVAQKGASDLSFSTLQESEVPRVAAIPGVAQAQGSLFHITRLGSNLFFFLVGVRPSDLAENPPDLQAGAVFNEGATDEVLLGAGAAGDLDASVGDIVTIDNREFRVTGIYRSEGLLENNGAYAPLVTIQEMTSKAGAISVIHVTVAPGWEIRQVASSIESELKNLVTMTNVDEYGKVDQGVRMLDAANIAISVLAVGIGAVGVMNTMVMSVFERTREIGIFRAVGWSGLRVLRMIIAESLMLCVAAAVAGTAAGMAISELVTLIPAVEKLLQPEYTTAIFVRAVGVAIIVALAGAAYPAFRAVRLTPIAALRYE